MFRKNKVIVDEDGFIAIYGEWINTQMACLMIVVYAPQDVTSKRSLWIRLNNLVLSFQAASIVLGDFNEVRFESERLGSTFCKYGGKMFNDFIINTDLVDLPMGGRKFTRMNKHGTKLSKLDRILVSNHFIAKWPNAQLLALPRDLSDHCPIILKTHSVDYGPIPFKFFNSWLLNDELNTLICQNWPKQTNTITHQNSPHPAISLKQKFQVLKNVIQTNSLWRRFITSIYGEYGGLENVDNNTHGLPSSPWKSVIELKNHLSCFDINLHTVFTRKVEDGSWFKFWEDHWIGLCNLKTS
ncbi:cytochrome P450 [Artemisia annua]|uniref:Cytochrome P450 n=1 Tax=Artemisia annua TaxID=35608 RepID=A0A2U1KNN1_ARTAN|nr:cytochrome P450 [Artemisia annua]